MWFNIFELFSLGVRENYENSSQFIAELLYYIAHVNGDIEQHIWKILFFQCKTDT